MVYMWLQLSVRLECVTESFTSPTGTRLLCCACVAFQLLLPLGLAAFFACRDLPHSKTRGLTSRCIGNPEKKAKSHYGFHVYEVTGLPICLPTYLPLRHSSHRLRNRRIPQVIRIQGIHTHLRGPEHPISPVATSSRAAVSASSRCAIYRTPWFGAGALGIGDRECGGLDLGVPGRVDGAVDCLRNGGGGGCEAVAALEHEVVVRAGGDIVWGGGGVVGGGQEGVGQGLPEAGIVDEVLGVVGGVVVGDFEDGCFLAFLFLGWISGV